MSISDQLIHTTVRIETEGPHGAGSGSGFFFHFCQSGDRNVPVIVTNKHVIDGSHTGKIHFTRKKSGLNMPNIGNHFLLTFEGTFDKAWIHHPNPDIDLAVFPIASIIQHYRNEKQEIYYVPFDMSLVADQAYMNELSAIEDIIMAGYPIGIWDSQNNLPIVRRGITATCPNVDFEGKPVFVIDCACFPGSSGSPVLLFNLGGYVDKHGNTNIGPNRIKLLGVLFAGPQFMTHGEIKVMPVPTSRHQIALSQIPSNLGYCVKAEQLNWFENYFQTHLDAEKKPPNAT